MVRFPAKISDDPQDAGAFFFPVFVIASNLGKSGPVNFFLDTGSSGTIMGENDVKKLGISFSELPRSPQPIAGWGGSTEAFTLEDVRICLKDSEGALHDFHMKKLICGMNPKRRRVRTKGVYRIAEVQSVPIPSVLGRDFLRDNSLVAHIDVRNKEVYLYD